MVDWIVNWIFRTVGGIIWPYQEALGYVMFTTLYTIAVIYSYIMKCIKTLFKFYLFLFYLYVMREYYYDAIRGTRIFYRWYRLLIRFILDGPTMWKIGRKWFAQEYQVFFIAAKHLYCQIKHEFMVIHWVLLHLPGVFRRIFRIEFYVKVENVKVRAKRFKKHFVLIKIIPYTKRHERDLYMFIIIFSLIILLYLLLF